MNERNPPPDERERRLLAWPAGAWSRRPRPRALLAVVPGVAAAAVVLAVVLIAAGGQPPAPAAQALDRAATAASGVQVPALGPGEYWYTRVIESSVSPYPLLPRTYTGTLATPATVLVRSRQSQETWVGVDGTVRHRQVTLSVRLAGAAAERLWRRSGSPYPSFGSSDSLTVGVGRFPPQTAGIGDVGDGMFSYRQLLGLPTNPRALVRALQRAQAGLERREARGFEQLQHTSGSSGSVSGRPIVLKASHVSAAVARADQLLTTIASMLTTPVTPAVRSALFRAAATLRGVVDDGAARDALGRAGVELQAGRGPGAFRMIFDPSTGQLLQTGFASVRGSRLALTETVAAQGVTDSVYAVPAGVAPSPGRLPAPGAASISPSTGGPSTVFRLALMAARPRRRAPAQFVQVEGRTGRDCRAYLFPPQVASLRSGDVVDVAPGGHDYVYLLRPSLLGRAAWCQGRYELQLGAQDQTEVYFQVR